MNSGYQEHVGLSPATLRDESAFILPFPSGVLGNIAKAPGKSIHESFKTGWDVTPQWNLELTSYFTQR